MRGIRSSVWRNCQTYIYRLVDKKTFQRFGRITGGRCLSGRRTSLRRNCQMSWSRPTSIGLSIKSLHFKDLAVFGTKYYWRQMLEWHKELTLEELSEVMFLTYIYRFVNKKLTFQRFSRIREEVLPEAVA